MSENRDTNIDERSSHDEDLLPQEISTNDLLRNLVIAVAIVFALVIVYRLIEAGINAKVKREIPKQVEKVT